MRTLRALATASRETPSPLTVDSENPQTLKPHNTFPVKKVAASSALKTEVEEHVGLTRSSQEGLPVAEAVSGKTPTPYHPSRPPRHTHTRILNWLLLADTVDQDIFTKLLLCAMQKNVPG